MKTREEELVNRCEALEKERNELGYSLKNAIAEANEARAKQLEAESAAQKASADQKSAVAYVDGTSNRPAMQIVRSPVTLAQPCTSKPFATQATLGHISLGPVILGDKVNKTNADAGASKSSRLDALLELGRKRANKEADGAENQKVSTLPPRLHTSAYYSVHV